MLSHKKPHVDPQPRFALLHHAMDASAGRFDHWDLMLEHGNVLVTFELERLPTGAGEFQARRLPDHRLAYLEYEGHISGNRGQVFRLDRGLYQEVHCNDAAPAVRRFHYHLHGQRLDAVLQCDQPLFLLPFSRAVQLEAARWDWHS